MYIPGQNASHSPEEVLRGLKRQYQVLIRTRENLGQSCSTLQRSYELIDKLLTYPAMDKVWVAIGRANSKLNQRNRIRGCFFALEKATETLSAWEKETPSERINIHARITNQLQHLVRDLEKYEGSGVGFIGYIRDSRIGANAHSYFYPSFLVNDKDEMNSDSWRKKQGRQDMEFEEISETIKQYVYVSDFLRDFLDCWEEIGVPKTLIARHTGRERQDYAIRVLHFHFMENYGTPLNDTVATLVNCAFELESENVIDSRRVRTVTERASN